MNEQKWHTTSFQLLFYNFGSSLNNENHFRRGLWVTVSPVQLVYNATLLQLLLIIDATFHCSWTLCAVFTALHEMQTRYCDENSVRLSVCPSVCHTRVL